jgi:putative hydrolase of the HAD superfamily
MSLPKAVLFDLDNTLWHRDAAIRKLAAAQHAAFPQLARVPLDAYVDRLIALDDRGHVDKAPVYQQLVTDFGLPDELVSPLRDHFWAVYGTCCEPAAGAPLVLTALRSMGIKTGIITNGTVAVQEPKIDGLGFRPLVDVVLVSEREGVRKPDAEIFHRALSRVGGNASEAWFVGDHPDADVRGAAEDGLTAVWLTTWADCAPHATFSIGTLPELLPLLTPMRQA